MFGSILAGLTALTMAVLAPVLLLPTAGAKAEPPKMLVIEAAEPEQGRRTVRLQVGQAVEELELEEYLVGVVLSEMPISFDLEALKAQAVAARTFALRQMDGGKHAAFDLCGQSSCCQAWAGEAVLEEKLGQCWQNYWDKAETAVKSTAGQVLTYEGELIDAVYFSCSGGTTEDAVAVWGGEVPYLQSVKSPGEEQAGKFHTEEVFSREEFCRIILEAQPLAGLSGRMGSWLGQTTRTAGGGVEKMTIGGCLFTGTQLRQLFGLNSTNFTLSVQGDAFVFSVYGYGHRVGMSQYGANAMAIAGKSYTEILKHYYEGVEVERWK